MHFTTPRSPSFVTADSHHLRESAKSSRGIWRKEAVPAFDQPLVAKDLALDATHAEGRTNAIVEAGAYGDGDAVALANVCAH